MRGVTIVLMATAVAASGSNGWANGIRLAQTSATTTCMMTCNSQAATCQSTCLIPIAPGAATAGAASAATTGAAPAATTTGNATANTACLLNCSSVQLACQTNCAQTSPSQ